jgi:mono/diheme cytochrome c family protein
MRLVVLTTFCLASLTKAQDVALFESKVLPVLKQRCFECHSHEQKMKGGLTLDSKSGWEQGGDSGAAVVVGKPDESLLIKMVRWADDEHQMPPKTKLPAAEIALLEEWVKAARMIRV